MSERKQVATQLLCGLRTRVPSPRYSKTARPCFLMRFSHAAGQLVERGHNVVTAVSMAVAQFLWTVLLHMVHGDPSLHYENASNVEYSLPNPCHPVLEFHTLVSPIVTDVLARSLRTFIGAVLYCPCKSV